ncbi:glycosyltransferase [Candidatus Palauibacter soopunensis]|uniref:glycosyltransferase n=1 Tax=Candidatus Palauibacter soopunensis TaxID=3056739 RepID=UPI0023929A40|nr:glycosyltransferase [Candidatus Palauibacter soopunensis]MDE2879654.1 glycosyltransferase [Candidatus Palauibacter soopunensis]
MTGAGAPRVSILLPCRDAEPFLGGCIESLVAQSEPRFEVLALDDGSSDGTGPLLRAWAERDSRVRLVDRDGSGIVAALRRLSDEARSPLLARMDADDVARPGRLAAQLRLLARRPDIAACGTGVRYFPRPRRGSGYLRYEGWINGLTEPAAVERDLFVECPIAHPTLMVRRDAFEAVGGYRDAGGPEDYDLILRLAAAGCRMTNVPQILHEWRLGLHRLSERSDRYSPDAFRRLKVAHLANGRVLACRPLVIWGAGKVGKAFARGWLEQVGAGSRMLPVEAFVDLDPRKIGQSIHGAVVLRPEDLPAFGAPARPYMLLAVGTPGARREIREALQALGFREIEDYRAVA